MIPCGYSLPVSKPVVLEEYDPSLGRHGSLKALAGKDRRFWTGGERTLCEPVGELLCPQDHAISGFAELAPRAIEASKADTTSLKGQPDADGALVLICRHTGGWINAGRVLRIGLPKIAEANLQRRPLGVEHVLHVDCGTDYHVAKNNNPSERLIMMLFLCVSGWPWGHRGMT